MRKLINCALAALPAALALTACQDVGGTTACGYAPSFKPSSNIGLDSEQRGHAATIVAVGAALGMQRRAVDIAITAALQESSLRNDATGDPNASGEPTAFGLFQMRPMHGWGTHGEVMDPEYAAAKFFKVLRKVKGWKSMSLADAAQAVEKSRDGSLYRDNQDHARRIVDFVSYRMCGKSGKKTKDPAVA